MVHASTASVASSFSPAPSVHMAPPHVLARLLLATTALAASAAGDGCSTGCGLALGSYLISRDQNLTYIARLFGIANYHTLAPYNPSNIDLDFIAAGQSVNVYFRCECRALPRAPSSTYLAASLPYTVSVGDTYATVAGHFSNLTTSDWLAKTNAYPATNNISRAGTVNVTVNCSCGNPSISPDYGLFLTYPLAGQTLAAAAAANYNFSSSSQLDLLHKYNPGMDTATSVLVFIPVKGDRF